MSAFASILERVRGIASNLVLRLILILLCAQSGGVLAQQQQFTGVAQPTNSPVVPEKPEEIRAKVEALGKQSMPDKDPLLIRELDRIDLETSLTSSARSLANYYKGTN